MLTPEPCFGTDHSRRSPASGPLQGTAGKEVAENVVSNPPRGRPFGGGGVHPTGLRGSLLHRGEFYNFTAWIIINVIPSKTDVIVAVTVLGSLFLKTMSLDRWCFYREAINLFSDIIRMAPARSSGLPERR